jgi:ankyrin repeat protein
LAKTDVNAQDEYDKTALHHAVSSSNIRMIRLLLANGADSDIANCEGQSAKYIASGISALKSELLR